MKTLQLDEKKARKLFKTAPAEFKETLIDTFGKEFFSEKITDRIKTFEDALAETTCSENAKMLLQYNGNDKDMIGALALLKLTIISRVLNEGWVPDWSNSNEYKFYPWFEWKKASSGLSFLVCVCSSTRPGTDVGSRLCYRTSELAEYAARQFESIYRDFLTL
jgi:hypothetical protein